MKIAIYTDINTITSEFGLTKDQKAIIQALYNFITTDVGERRYKHKLGFNTSDYIFEFFDDIGAFQLKTDLITQLREQEPRITPVFALSQIISDVNKYKLKLVFTIDSLSDKQFEFIGEIFR